MLKAELTHHLGYPEGGKRGPDGNARNGFPPKSLLTESWAISLEISRDHDGSFTPQFVPKGARRLPGFDETVLMLYARGLSTRELQAFLDERYQIPVSPDLISTITSEVLAEVETWQQRPLKATYVAGAFDALCVKSKRTDSPCHRRSAGGRMRSELFCGIVARGAPSPRGADYCGFAAPYNSRQRSGKRSCTGTSSRSLRSTSVTYGSGGTPCCAQVRISE